MGFSLEEGCLQSRHIRAGIGGSGGGCCGVNFGMALDNQPRENDLTFHSEGVQVLVDPTSLAYLSGTSIDFDDGLQGKGFEIRNPNAQSTCGCGKSFN